MQDLSIQQKMLLQWYLVELNILLSYKMSIYHARFGVASNQEVGILEERVGTLWASPIK